MAGGDEDALDDYQELNAREEQDIEGMMEVCEYAISNAEGFAEKLSRELQVLDGVSYTCSGALVLRVALGKLAINIYYSSLNFKSDLKSTPIKSLPFYSVV